MPSTQSEMLISYVLLHTGLNMLHKVLLVMQTFEELVGVKREE